MDIFSRNFSNSRYKPRFLQILLKNLYNYSDTSFFAYFHQKINIIRNLDIVFRIFFRYKHQKIIEHEQIKKQQNTNSKTEA